jgi:hypothetical protein
VSLECLAGFAWTRVYYSTIHEFTQLEDYGKIGNILEVRHFLTVGVRTMKIGSKSMGDRPALGLSPQTPLILILNMDRGSRDAKFGSI